LSLDRYVVISSSLGQVCCFLVADAAQDLIRQCLSVDPSKRPSSFHELLHHPWLNPPADIVRTLFE